MMAALPLAGGYPQSGIASPYAAPAQAEEGRAPATISKLLQPNELAWEEWGKGPGEHGRRGGQEERSTLS